MAIEDDKPAAPNRDKPHSSSGRAVDIWVCEGRMCTAKAAGDLVQLARTSVTGRVDVRVLRGGCYGQCDLSPNVVVREHAPGAIPEVDLNRLSRTFEANETVYARVDAAGLERIIAAHLQGDPIPADLTLRAREQREAPANDVAARIRALRLKKRAERKQDSVPVSTSNGEPSASK